MKSLVLLTCLVVLASCSKPFYQIYKVQPDKKMNIETNSISFKDNNCVVDYNFWSQNGNIYFLIRNISDESIYIHLDESFLVINGIAKDYYQAREYGYSKSSTLSKGLAKSSSNAVGVNYTGKNYLYNLIQSVGGAASVSKSYNVQSATTSGETLVIKEKKTVCIPPKSAKMFYEYDIAQQIYRDCGLLLYPAKKDVNSLSFTETNTPIKFENLIVYTKENSEEKIRVKNNFYVSEISNFSESEITYKDYPKNCEGKNVPNSTKETYFKNTAPNKFYIEYKKLGNAKH